MEGDSGEAGERGRSVVSRCFTEHSSPSMLKVLASTLTPGPLFQLCPEEPLPDSTAPRSNNPVQNSQCLKRKSNSSIQGGELKIT